MTAESYNERIAALDTATPGFARMMSLLIDVLAVEGTPDAALDDLLSRAMTDLTVDQVASELEERPTAHVEGVAR